MRIGETRANALQKMVDRVEAPSSHRSSARSSRPTSSESRSAAFLRVQATDTRNKRQAAAEEKAMKAPIKMLFPTALFIFPAMFISHPRAGLPELQRNLLLVDGCCGRHGRARHTRATPRPGSAPACGRSSAAPERVRPRRLRPSRPGRGLRAPASRRERRSDADRRGAPGRVGSGARRERGSAGRGVRPRDDRSQPRGDFRSTRVAAQRSSTSAPPAWRRRSRARGARARVTEQLTMVRTEKERLFRAREPRRRPGRALHRARGPGRGAHGASSRRRPRSSTAARRSSRSRPPASPPRRRRSPAARPRSTPARPSPRPSRRRGRRRSPA
jgi:hypothetical protein